MILEERLHKTFGLATFRPGQREIIEHVLGGGSGLVIMPTGFGKSLCFQLPSVLLEGLTLVISPLIALAEDQVRAARARGLKASYINSSLTREERERRWEQVKAGKIRLLYVTPERLRLPEFKQATAALTIRLLAVDEAHCLSQWGHDFRPEYGRLGERREQMGGPPVLALTATATPLVQTEIIEQLGLREAPIWNLGFARPNLFFAVNEVLGLEEKIQHLVALRHRFAGPCIVYFSLISTLEKCSSELRRLNLSHVTYHGQLNDSLRLENQKHFMGGEADLILATPAFGLGIDKSNIRLIVHAEVPGSLEAYYQEAGRAGRDGGEARCQLLYDRDDVSIQMDFLKWANPEAEFVRATMRLVKENLAQVRQEGADFLREKLLFYHRRDFRVETVMNWLERWGVIEWPHHNYARLNWLADPDPEWLKTEVSVNRTRTLNEKLLAMVQWAESETCRRQRIDEYFGQTSTGLCGHCDLCRTDLA